MGKAGRPRKYTAEEKSERLYAYHREYSRKYRLEHPEDVKRYRENYIINEAARILARREAERKAAEEAGEE